MTKLIIVHGWTHYAEEMWKPLLALLRGRGIELEFLPVPGLTDGTNPTWTLDDYVAWLHERTSGYDKVVLYGHSNGGRISLAFTARHPEKVARLILEGSAGIPPRGLRKLKRNVMRKLAEAGHMLKRSAWIRNLVYRIIRENDYRVATPEMRKTLSNLVSVDLTPVLERITCPTLIIWGAGDTMTPLWSGNLMHEKIRGSRMVVIPEARHSPHITHPDMVADLVEKEMRS